MKLSSKKNIAKMKVLINEDNIPKRMDTSLSILINNLLFIKKELDETDDLSFDKLNHLVKSIKESNLKRIN